MTREQAIEAANKSIASSSSSSLLPEAIIRTLEAAGLLKFDEPLPKTHHVPALSYCQSSVSGNSALIREDTLIETLRMAGYEVTKPVTAGGNGGTGRAHGGPGGFTEVKR